MKQIGLGRGLDALFGDKIVEPKAKPMTQTAELKLADIIPDPNQPRKHFDENALEELSDSIRTYGVIQPITVRKEGDRYMIISGERRWRAATLAGLQTIPAYTREADSEEVHAMALVENIQREDLNAIEVAMGMQRLIEECGLTQETLAEKVGKKRSTVANFLRLLSLPDQIQKAVKEGYISMGHAKAFASLPSSRRQVTALHRCLKHNLSVRGAEEMVRHMLSEKPVRTPSSQEDYPDSYARLVEELEVLFNQDIAIRRGKNGGGKIVIGFSSDEDIDQIIDRLKTTNKGKKC